MTFRVNMEGTNSWLICDNKSTLLKLFVFIGKYSITLVYFFGHIFANDFLYTACLKIMCWTFTEEDWSIPISAEDDAQRTSVDMEKGRRRRRTWISSPRMLGSAQKPPLRKPLMRGTWQNRYLYVPLVSVHILVHIFVSMILLLQSVDDWKRKKNQSNCCEK